MAKVRAGQNPIELEHRLEEKIVETKEELQKTKETEPDKDKRIARLESKLEILEAEKKNLQEKINGLERENQDLKNRITELETQLTKVNISQRPTFYSTQRNILISEKEKELQKAKDDLRFYKQVLTTPAFEKASYEVQDNKRLDARQAENKVKSLERQLERLKVEQGQQGQYFSYTEIPPKGNN